MPRKLHIRHNDTIVGDITKIEMTAENMVVTFKITHCYQCGTRLKIASGIGEFCPNRKCEVGDGPFKFITDRISVSTETIGGKHV